MSKLCYLYPGTHDHVCIGPRYDLDVTMFVLVQDNIYYDLVILLEMCDAHTCIHGARILIYFGIATRPI